MMHGQRNIKLFSIMFSDKNYVLKQPPQTIPMTETPPFSASAVSIKINIKKLSS